MRFLELLRGFVLGHLFEPRDPGAVAVGQGSTLLLPCVELFRPAVLLLAVEQIEGQFDRCDPGAAARPFAIRVRLEVPPKSVADPLTLLRRGEAIDILEKTVSSKRIACARLQCRFHPAEASTKPAGIGRADGGAVVVSGRSILLFPLTIQATLATAPSASSLARSFHSRAMLVFVIAPAQNGALSANPQPSGLVWANFKLSASEGIVGEPGQT
ncbi:hypothetical protein ACE103_16185 [Bradyrhizobium sp. ma5]|uniref:hypothetical protein n=1 Tax=Bradyrhizobium sp. ma5 TaxID=3344828 RepID=UPI0035D3DC93